MPVLTKQKYKFKWPSRKEIWNTFTIYLIRFIIFCDDGATKEGMKCGYTANIMNRINDFCNKTNNMELTSIDYVYVNNESTMKNLEKWAHFCCDKHCGKVKEQIMPRESKCGGQTECYYYKKDI